MICQGTTRQLDHKMVDCPILWKGEQELHPKQPVVVGGGSRRDYRSAQHAGTVPVLASIGSQTPAPTGAQAPAPADVPGGFGTRIQDDFDLDDFG